MKKISRFPSPLIVMACAFALMTCAVSAQLPGSLTNGLQALWTFNGNANDASGNGNNLTAPNGASYTVGRNGTLSATLNGINNFFWLPDALTTNNAFTWSLWFRTENPTRPLDTIMNQGGPLSGSPQTSPGISSNDTSGPPGISILAYTYDFGAGNQNIYSTPLNLSSSDWVSVIWTSDSSGNRALYIDGQLNNTSLGQLYGQFNDNLYIGGVPQIDVFAPQNYFEGQLSDIAIWDRPLSEAEVTDLYAIQSVPEPSTYALLLLSGAASLWALKRRKS